MLRMFWMTSLLLGWVTANAAEKEFGAAINLTGFIKGLEFSRNPQNVMQLTADGTVHFVYMLPDNTQAPPNTNIFYLAYQNDSSAGPIRINHATGTALHPALSIDDDLTVHIAWQDSRHSTAAGNFIDNLEIYYNRMPRNGDFFPEDRRITDTTAAHLGDNGFAPQITTDAEGRIHIVWYDFHINGNNADVYLRSSEEEGLFPPQEGIDDFRLTMIESAEGFASNWLPTLTPMNGALYILWGFQNGFTAFFDIQGMIYDGQTNPIESITASGGRFLDPPRLESDANGNLGVVYPAVRENRSVILFQYRNREAWREPIALSQSPLNASQPDLAFDSQGHAHVVWLEDAGGVFEIRYAEILPESLSIPTIQAIGSAEVDARTPVIGIQPQTDRITIAWIDRRSLDGSALYLVQEEFAAIQTWKRWE